MFFLREGSWKTVIFFGAKKCCGVGFSKLEIMFFSANPWDMKKIERSTSKRNTHSFDQQIIHHLPFVPEKLHHTVSSSRQNEHWPATSGAKRRPREFMLEKTFVD